MRAIVATCLACLATAAPAVELEPLWTTGGLPNPESVIAAPDGESLFVSNVNGAPDARDGNGTISRLSRDGEVIATAMKAVKVATIRGSSAKGDKRKGGVIAMREMLRHLDANGCVAIAPDGPRGPRMRAQLGVIQLAKRAQCPIIVMGWGMKGEKIMRSWDRFAAPPLFGRGVCVWGGPLTVAADASPEAMEAARALLETELQRVTLEACAMAGSAAIEPEPPAPALEPAPS